LNLSLSEWHAVLHVSLQLLFDGRFAIPNCIFFGCISAPTSLVHPYHSGSLGLPARHPRPQRVNQHSPLVSVFPVGRGYFIGSRMPRLYCPIFTLAPGIGQ